MKGTKQIFCLTCKKLSSPGSTYCAYCPGGKSFNSIRCSAGHRCNIGVVTCPTCGSGEFSEHVYGVPTGWVAKLLTVAIVIYLWKLGLAHSDTVFGAFGAGAALAFGLMTNSDGNALGYVLQTGLFYLVMAWVFGLWLSIMPGGGGSVGKFLRSIPVLLWKQALRWIPRLGSLLWKGVMSLSGLTSKKPATLALKGKGKQGKDDEL